MTSVVIAGADGDLGRAIAAACSRSHDVRAIVRQLPSSAEEVPWPTVRSDLLDCPAPAAFLDGCQVLVVPFGQFDGARLDFYVDLHTSTVVGALGVELQARGVALVLVGRGPHAQAIGTGRAVEGAHLLAERAVLLCYAMHTEVQWTYLSPGRVLDSAKVRRAPESLLELCGDDVSTMVGGDTSMDGYARWVVDHIERSVPSGLGASRTAR